MFFSLLSQRTIVEISGADYASFLQGLLTNDVNRLTNAPALYTALLSPQGKYLHAFFLYAYQDKLLLDCEASQASILQKRLMMYRLRAKVSIEKTDLCVAALWDADDKDVQAWADKSMLCVRDPRLKEMGYRLVLSAQQAATLEDNGKYEAWRLSHVMPDEVHDLQAEKSFPLQYGFEALNAVDFKKGCYVGQEVTARTKHRGTLRKILCGVSSDSTPLPAAGSTLYVDGKSAGEMLSSEGLQGVALLQADHVLVNQPPMLSHAPDGEAYLKPFVPSWFKMLLES